MVVTHSNLGPFVLVACRSDVYDHYGGKVFLFIQHRHLYNLVVDYELYPHLLVPLIAIFVLELSPRIKYLYSLNCA